VRSSWLHDSQNATLPVLGSTDITYSFLPLLEERRSCDNAEAAGSNEGCSVDLPHNGFSVALAADPMCYEVWIAMELCDGGTLSDQILQGFQYLPDSRQANMVSLSSRGPAVVVLVAGGVHGTQGVCCC
jgi:hypothetical protein